MKLKSTFFFLLVWPLFAHAKIAGEQMTAIFDFFETYSVLMLLALVLCILMLMANYISIKWMTNKLAKKFGMGSASAFVLVITVFFASYYYFNLLALILYSLWGALIKIREYGYKSSCYIFNDFDYNDNTRCESSTDSACDGDGGGD